MPGLVRKLLIFAAAEGVLLQPVTTRNQVATAQSITIDYKSNTISPSLQQQQEQQQQQTSSEPQANNNGYEGLEAHGVVGLLKLASSSYLVAISRREQIAQIRGKPVYVITGVDLIPLSSQSEAQAAITHARTSSARKSAAAIQDDDTDTDDDASSSSAATAAEHDEEQDSVPSTPIQDTPGGSRSGRLQKSTTVVADVIKNKGSYGRFAQKWFSKAGWTTEGRRKQGMSSDNLSSITSEQEKAAQDALPDGKEHEADVAAIETADPVVDETSTGEQPPSSLHAVMENLTPRILRTTKLFFASHSFYFSYDYDISRSLPRQENTSSTVPLYKRFDPLFFWNRHLVEPLIQSGQSSFILPLIQGFVGQRAFTIAPTDGDSSDAIVDSKALAGDVVELQNRDDPDASSHSNNARNFLLTLISRRSVRRAGLRYLRRGVDDDGNVANSVETEQIISTPSWDSKDKVFSFMQIRGSMPLFFSQSPYSFKPVPVMYGSEATNETAFRKHFANVFARYGDVFCTSLVDKHGNEVKIGTAYEKTTEQVNKAGGVNGKQIGFEWFDFHTVCRGMKFENVSILMNTIAPFVQKHTWTVQENNEITHAQSGVLRVNCMDCLDRTNVVQSATAGQVLQKQLQELGLTIDLQTDPKTAWFNTLWADNGDAISRQYAGTAALKGDFTRTRKRNWTGALADFSLTLNRYYNNIFGDYFLQTCISYYLGEASLHVFEEFETDMMTRDPSLNLPRIRESAIETCTKIVLEDPDTEDFFAGWTLACPSKSNTLRGLPFEECVLLLTDKALYFCRFDWTTEKVGSFERVELQDIEQLYWGAYITSTLGPTHMDESKNVGFVVRFRSKGEATVRTNTRSLANEKAAETAEEDRQPQLADTHSESQDENNDNKAQSQSIEAKDMAHESGPTEDTQRPSQGTDSESRILAFKALPPSRSAIKGDDGDDDNEDMGVTDKIHGHRSAKDAELSETKFIQHVCEEIERLSNAAQRREGRELKIEHSHVIGLDEARRSTGYLESLGYSLKKLVWS